MLVVVPFCLSGCSSNDDEDALGPSFTTTTTTTVAWVRRKQGDAQFLIQATFGPTRSSLEALSRTSYEDWIDDQMALPVGSHRVYYRSKVNSRLTHPVIAGGPRSACSQGSRWHNYAITVNDVGKPISVHSNRVSLDGTFRTDIDPAYSGNGLSAPNRNACTNTRPNGFINSGKMCETTNVGSNCRSNVGWKAQKYCQKSCYDQGWGYEGDDCSTGWADLEFDGYICKIAPLEQAVGGYVMLANDSDCSWEKGISTFENPALWLVDPTQSTESTAQFDATFKTDVLLLTESPASCNLDGLIRVAGKYYLHDSRLELLQNTLENPVGTTSVEACPAVAKTFLNEESCKLQPACTPLYLVDAEFQLNRSTLELFYTVAGKYVYAISGLRTEGSPCGSLARWKRLDCSTVACSASSLSSEDSEAIRTGLEGVEGWLRDIDVSCSSVPAHSVVQVDTEYFAHVPLNEYNVYDFSAWVEIHPGGMSAIKKWVTQDFELVFPSSHAMTRWNAGTTRRSLEYIGRMGDVVNFQGLPAPLQTSSIAAQFNLDGTSGYFQACGSPGESANIPAAGNQLSFFSIFNSQDSFTDRHFDKGYYSMPPPSTAKSTVWTMKALTGQDQLRQRVAWALAQIFVVGVEGFGDGSLAEFWINYYDIFVRNAFGNFRDVLREVTYSPLMGAYLTYKRNSAYDHDNTYPDENYAREIMQLFTIGLWKLSSDGSRVLDSKGDSVPTYSNEHIMNFARVLTGFDQQLPRANMEKTKGGVGNVIDPMRMKVDLHDIYPKPDLDGNFLGDGYPLCTDLPVKAFLAEGARYEFLGHTYHLSDVFVAEPASALYTVLCGSSGSCTFSLNVVLGSSLSCHSEECSAQTLKVVKVATGYYEYVPPVCVNLFFYSDGYTTAPGGSQFLLGRKCNDPNTAVAGTSCCAGCDNRRTDWMNREGHTCENATDTWSAMFASFCNGRSNWRKGKFCQLACWENGVGYDGDDCSAGVYREERLCSYPGERVRFDQAEAACASHGMAICAAKTSAGSCAYTNSVQVWTPSNCSHTIEVFADGKVAAQNDDDAKQNQFSVAWQNGDVPDLTADPPGGCIATSDSFLCRMRVVSQAVFDIVPDKAELLAWLKLGALRPSMSCTVCSGEVKAYAIDGVIDESTIFEYEGRFYKNFESIVYAGDRHSFRNPPAFMQKDDRSARSAIAEVESLLDHVFHHANTPVFIGYRLIQRFVTSNPSPEYIQDVGDAFRTGSFEGKVYSGAYGDLAATVAAVLLHPQARAGHDSQFSGALREPLLKVIHFLRSMGYEEGEQREVVLRDLEDKIGQAPYGSPSVFNFYYADYQPARFSGNTVAPEFQIFNAPFAISFLNGMLSIIDNGVSECDNGFGQYSPRGCIRGTLNLGIASSMSESLEELDLLLTGGRLDISNPLVFEAYENATEDDKLQTASARVVREAYATASNDDKLKAAQRAIVMTPEFHAMGQPLVSGIRQPIVVQEVPAPRSYKAVVMLYLAGGADTFNMLVPYQCSLFDEYNTVRGDIALQPFQLHGITTTGQRCSQFGIHHKFGFLKELYDRKKAAFVSNVGALVKPITKLEFKQGGATTCVGLFSHSDQTQAAQTLQCQVPGAAPKGVGGRIADALASRQYRTTSFSIAGTTTWSQGFDTSIETIHRKRGAVRLKKYQDLQSVIGNITSRQHRNVYCEEYAKQFAEAIKSSESLGTYLDSATLQTQYSSETVLAQQFHQVARLISTREQRKAERDFFFVSLGGFDTHANVNEVLDLRFKEIDDALRDFVGELEAQGVFDSVVITTASDFGRSLTSNGAGTDHAWAGNHFIVGGSINGGRVFNDFPVSLLEGNDQDAGRGRMIPKYPWESMMVPIAEWMGIESSQRTTVFPNLGNFNLSTHIIGTDTLFTR